MNKNYLLLAVVIIGAGILYKRAMEGVEKGKEKSVTLLSNDGKDFTIPHDNAMKSPFLKDMAVSFEGHGSEVRLDYASEFLQPIVDFLLMPMEISADNFVAKEFAHKDTAFLRGLINCSMFLGLNDLAVSLTPLYIEHYSAENPDTTMKDIKLSLGNASGVRVIAVSLFSDERKAMKTALNLDNVIISRFQDRDLESLKKLLVVADFAENAAITQSLLRLYIFKSLKANPLLTADSIKDIVKEKSLNDSIDAEYLVIKFSAGFNGMVNRWALAFPEELPGTVSEKKVTNLYGLLLVETLTGDKPTVASEYLVYINLDRSPIKEVQSAAFAGFSKLKQLFIGNASLVSLSDTSFAGLPNLETLAIENTHLKSLPQGIFAGLTELYSISITNNKQLSSLDGDLFAGLTNLTKIYLNGNNLSSIPNGLFKGLDKLSEVRILYKNNLSMTHEQIRALFDPAIRDSVLIE